MNLKPVAIPVILGLAFLAPGCASLMLDDESAKVQGAWVCAVDLPEYHGLYVYDFTAGGALYLNDYKEDRGLDDAPERRQVGTWSVHDRRLVVEGSGGTQADRLRFDKFGRMIRTDEKGKAIVYFPVINKGGVLYFPYGLITDSVNADRPIQWTVRRTPSAPGRSE